MREPIRGDNSLTLREHINKACVCGAHVCDTRTSSEFNKQEFRLIKYILSLLHLLHIII